MVLCLHCILQAEDPVPGDLVLPLKFRAPPSGVHLLQVRTCDARFAFSLSLTDDLCAPVSLGHVHLGLLDRV